MKRFFTLMFVITTSYTAIFPQSDSVVVDGTRNHLVPSFFVIINGKVPLKMRTEFHIDSELYPDTIVYYFNNNFKSFSIGDEILNFDKVIPDSSKIYIKYIFDEYIQYVCDDGVSGGYYKYKQHIYYDTLEWHTFKHVGIVIISDLNVKKKQYYIHYELEAPWVQPIKYKKEYGNPRRFYKKIFKGVYPVHYKARDGKRLKGKVSSIFR